MKDIEPCYIDPSVQVNHIDRCLEFGVITKDEHKWIKQGKKFGYQFSFKEEADLAVDGETLIKEGTWEMYKHEYNYER